MSETWTEAISSSTSVAWGVMILISMFEISKATALISIIEMQITVALTPTKTSSNRPILVTERRFG